MTRDGHRLIPNPTGVIAQVENHTTRTVVQRSAERLAEISRGVLPELAHVHMRQVRARNAHPVDAAGYLDRLTHDVQVDRFGRLPVKNSQANWRPGGTAHQFDDLVQRETGRITPVYPRNDVPRAEAGALGR